VACWRGSPALLLTPDASGEIARIWSSEHYEMMLEFYGVEVGLRTARKHARLVSRPLRGRPARPEKAAIMISKDPADVSRRMIAALGGQPVDAREGGRMSKSPAQDATIGNALAMAVLNSVQNPVILVDAGTARSRSRTGRRRPSSAPALPISPRTRSPPSSRSAARFSPLIDQVRERKAPVNEYRVDLSSPRLGQDKLVDLYVAPVVSEPGSVVVVFQERSMADKIDRQLTHRAAARSVTGLASMLAHEIKNPLSGIRGAAQLLESVVPDEDRALTQLICDETDRIVSLVDRMEVFSDERPVDRIALNIHSVLDHVKAVAKAGFARKIKISEMYDPSLPPVFANRDQLVQVFLNLIKNAAEAVGDSRTAKSC
jgi:two-component system nitrogen regulation sensor histidine kinase GlnL